MTLSVEALDKKPSPRLRVIEFTQRNAIIAIDPSDDIPEVAHPAPELVSGVLDITAQNDPKIRE
jgi:hypothetical protein